MSDQETSPQNSMDVDGSQNEQSSSPRTPTVTSTVLRDLGVGSGHISGSDDEEIQEPTTSKGSTPDSTTLTHLVNKKLVTTKKPSLTKTKSALVNYERDSDDDEHTDEEESVESDQEQDRDNNDEESNSNNGPTSRTTDDIDPLTCESTISKERTAGASDLSNVVSFKGDDVPSPSSRPDMTPTHQMMFPEDAEIRIPSQSSKRCPAELEEKFEQYYKLFKSTGIDQNARIQMLKDFRNPSMYEKIISHLGIDEIGTNFPQDLYDPHVWGKDSYYEELSKVQRLEMDRREKERRERTKIGFTPGVKKIEQLGIGPTSNSESAVEKRKNRFDQ